MLDSHKEEQRNVVAAQEDLLLRGRIVFFFFLLEMLQHLCMLNWEEKLMKKRRVIIGRAEF